MQINVSPYLGTPDLSALQGMPDGSGLDNVSLADILRNSFVYPPHSIFRGVKLASLGFNPDDDLAGRAPFRFPFPETDKRRPGTTTTDGLVGIYHQKLCDAIALSTAGMQHPWVLQSGGKDSTSLAIAMSDARPDATCLTYRGGREENETASAARVAAKLGLRHEQLACDPARAYDRYVGLVARMPLLTADFALLSYVDLATDIQARGGDGIVDGLGSDLYFGMPMGNRALLLARLACGQRWPARLSGLPLVQDSFAACFLLATLQMTRHERHFPGSRFTDDEVDTLFGRPISVESKSRLARFDAALLEASGIDEMHSMLTCLLEPAALGKGIYTAAAMGFGLAYPFCDRGLIEWIHRQVPRDKLADRSSGMNKVLVREHIATRFGKLPYVARKGSFRFDLVGLARARFEQVHGYALDARAVLPGAAGWLESHRQRLGNKYHASKFYLLAVVLPWILSRTEAAASQLAPITAAGADPVRARDPR